MSSLPDPNADRIDQLEREIAQLQLTSGGAKARLTELDQELKSLKGAPAKNVSWQRVQLARHMKRPHSSDYIQRLAPDFTEIHGDRAFGEDPAIICGFGTVGGEPMMLIGQQKGRDTKQKLFRNFGMPKPEGYRKALRAMELASKFRRPIVTLLDTPGAYPGIDAEERGQAQAIALNLREMARIESPIVVIVIGEGGSGGALALGIGNRVYMLENSVYSVISPESCAAIIYRDSSKGELAAAALKITATDLLRLKLIDGIIPEPPGGAHEDYDKAAELLGQALLGALTEFKGKTPQQLIDERYEKFRNMGNFFTEPAA
jgi:acetyl-CoA carboxylase carboxyl transferase subunit alpha